MCLRAIALLLLAALPLAVPRAAAKTLVYCSEGSPENFYPGINATLTSFDASSRPLYNRLVEFERGGTRLVPGLAASWEVSADGRAYTFHLRRGVKWQTTRDFAPTRDFDADDVVFSFARQWRKDDPWYRVTSDDHGYFDAMGFPALLKSIDKLDDHTVRFVLNAPEAPFLADLAMDFASIISEEYADRMMAAGTPERLDQAPVGTGPFQLERYRKDTLIRYRANPDYWQGKAKLDSLVFAITPDAAVRLAKLKANECQVMADPDPADIPAITADPALALATAPGLNIGYIAFNTRKTPFGDVRVRRAVAMAVDKRAIIAAVYGGMATPAATPIPPGLWSHDDAIADYPYDPAAARKLLAEAGYPRGFATTLWALPLQRPYNPNGRRMATLVQAELAAIGVRAEIVSYEWGEYRRRLNRGEYDMAEIGWIGDNGDPDNFLYTLLACPHGTAGSGNSGGWCDPRFQSLVLAAKRSADQAQRARLYRQAQAIFHDAEPWVPIAYGAQVDAIRRSVQDYKPSPFGHHDFYGVDLRQ
ncbi:MAG TPA: ABC transporter substrate-binding protein [Alphaproteobacteria bacterium]|nr:ABC transporter substrate-binding protein [Alphaproteobacteria bacterium]